MPSVVKPTIRCAENSDAAAIAAIYAPYVRDTPVSFEIEPPTAEITVGTSVQSTSPKVPVVPNQLPTTPH